MTGKRAEYWLGTLAALLMSALASAAHADNGPVIDQIIFSGNHEISTADLTKLTTVTPGAPLATDTIRPDLGRIIDAYERWGGAIVAPSIVETSADHVNLIYQINEHPDQTKVALDKKGWPQFMHAFFGNTLVCAAAKTGNDLCHTWLESDGTFVTFDNSGVRSGHFTVGPVRPDGRVPICRYWDSLFLVTPPELAPKMMAPTPAPGAKPVAMIMACTTANFHTTCKRTSDRSTLSPDELKAASYTMTQRFHYVGVCYAHGPHKIGDVWYEWDDPLPGQIGLDREMLLAGHQ